MVCVERLNRVCGDERRSLKNMHAFVPAYLPTRDPDASRGCHRTAHTGSVCRPVRTEEA